MANVDVGYPVSIYVPAYGHCFYMFNELNFIRYLLSAIFTTTMIPCFMA